MTETEARERIESYLDTWAAGGLRDRPMLGRLIMFWCAAPALRIRKPDQSLGYLEPLPGQAILHAALMDQAAAGKPLRLVVGKSRKSHGISTWVQCLGVFLCAHYENQIAVTIAHAAKATEEIFDIARRAAKSYLFLDPSITSELRWPPTQSKYYCQTAGAAAAIAGGTPSFLHQSEVAKWEGNKEETEYNSKIAVPDEPTTIIVQESTFLGQDLFWQRFDSARANGGAYAALFLPWFLDNTLDGDVTQVAELSSEELTLQATAERQGLSITPAQFAWRRGKIEELGLTVFRQEFPSTPEEAVLGSKGLILPGIRNLLVDSLPFERSCMESKTKIGGIDFGYHDPCVVWSGFEHDRCIYLTDYYRRAEGLASEHVEGLEDHTTYYCDPSGVSDRKNLEQASYRAGLHCTFLSAPRKKNPGEDPTHVEIQRLVKYAEQDRLFILRGASQQLLRECDNYAWNEKTGKPDDYRDEVVGHFDSIAALRYLIAGVDSRIRLPHRDGELRLTRRAQWAMA